MVCTFGSYLHTGDNYWCTFFEAQGEYVSLSQQLEQFSIVKQRLNEELGATAASRLVAGSIYYISTGSNDFINNYLLPGNPHLDIFPDGYERLLVSSFSDLIKVRERRRSQCLFCFPRAWISLVHVRRYLKEGSSTS